MILSDVVSNGKGISKRSLFMFDISSADESFHGSSLKC